MTTSEEEITRGHEHYLRHLLLLGQAAPVGVKAVIEREVRYMGNLANLLAEQKDTFKEFPQLFQDDEVNANINSWDIHLLCVVTLVLFKSCLTNTELEAILCISDQRKDLDNYAHSASLSYKTFKTKWDPLHSAILDLIKVIGDERAKFECKRMIHSFKSESFRVNIELINRMKQTKDVNLHVQMAIQDKVVPKIHGGDVRCYQNKPLGKQTDNPVFTENLQDTFVYVDEPAILRCKLNVSETAVMWKQDDQPVEQSDNLMFVDKKCIHWLAISHAKITDTGFYSCICGQPSTTAFLKVSEKPLKIIKNLHVATAEVNVRVNADIILTCTVDQHSNNSVWLHNGKEIKPCDRLRVSVQELEHKLTIFNATLEDEGDYTVDYGDVKSSTTLKLKENPVFTKKLQDTFVYVGEPAVITCKLNVSDKAVIWRHDYKPVEATDNLKLVADKCTHWLVISNTKFTDAGYYSCECGIESTKASLKVLERPLMITEELHVTTAKADVRENMDIVLMCSVNLHTYEVIWKHDGTEITQCIRRQVTVHGLEHKLTIRNAKFEDDGDYTVAFGGKKSSTNLIIKGNLNLLHKKQLTEDLFKNWIRGALGIKYLKQGIQEFAETSVQSHHYEIKKQLPSVVCENCSKDVLLPSHKQGQCPKKSKCLCSKQEKNRRVCQSQGFCSKLYDKILFDHRFFDLTLSNTAIQSWGTDPWSVATCYISTTGYRGKASAKEVDCSGLLSMLINNTFIHRILGDVEINGETDLFKQAKDARNDILHNANYELSEGQLQCYIDLFKDVLEMKDAKGEYPLSRQPGAQDAISNLNELQQKQIDIRASQDFKKQIQDIREHTRGELAEKIEEAEKQNKWRVQQLEEQLEMTEKELQLMRDLRSTKAKSEKTKVPFELELHIQVNGPTGNISSGGNQRIYETMDIYVTNRNMEVDAHINSTDRSVNRLLGHISKLKDCKISDGLRTEKYACIKIHCFTCEAIEVFLKLINGNEFQEDLVVLRKCLERWENIKVHDVIVSCSSESIGNTRKRLYGRGSTQDFICSYHQGTQCTWYCSDRDVFCCSTCKETDHRSCVGLKQVVSERSYGQQNQRFVVERKIGDYNVQIKNRFINRDDNDEDDCDIRSIRMLPDSNILLLDIRNLKLKKLDSSYNVVSHCRFPRITGTWMDLCYIGNDRAVVCSADGMIQYVKVSGKMKLKHAVQLDHRCYALVCHGDTLYVIGRDKVYTYTIHCQRKHLLYNIKDTETYLTHIAISDDGERIYITNGVGGLITIDNKGNHLFTLKSDICYITIDLCVVGNGRVLVLDSEGSVHQVDYSGKQVFGAVVDRSFGSPTLWVLCFDRKRCRLIIARDEVNCISVFELQQHNSDTDII